MQFYCDHMSRLGSIADYYVTKVAAAAHGRTWASWRATAPLRWARMPGGRQLEGPAGARASLKAHTGSVCAVYSGPQRGRAPLRGAWAFQKAAPPSLPLASAWEPFGGKAGAGRPGVCAWEIQGSSASQRDGCWREDGMHSAAAAGRRRSVRGRKEVQIEGRWLGCVQGRAEGRRPDAPSGPGHRP